MVPLSLWRRSPCVHWEWQPFGHFYWHFPATNLCWEKWVWEGKKKNTVVKKFSSQSFYRKKEWEGRKIKAFQVGGKCFCKQLRIMPIDSERPDPFIHYPTVFTTLFSVISWGPYDYVLSYPSTLQFWQTKEETVIWV